MEKELLIPNDEYLKSGIHIGTKFKTKYMENFIYKTRPDGLSVLNVQQIDARIKVLISFMSNYAPEDIIVVARRENGWKPVQLFGELTGAKTYIGRYPPGILTNIQLRTFTEAKVLFVTDPWPDRNAVEDAIKMGIPVIALCDTNNQTNNIDLVVPGNNKGRKSLGLVFWLLTKGYLENRGMINKGGFTHTVDDFSDE
ncbi:MAG: 30S ribosomal protein S2 [Nanoarchaeota archaeon]|nr:30S ribosomal protein S2 [Nanoarchaeota archaeon]MBU1322072.1 30S ribosomal protein S2 [Nanoarchaeota archaeon]MBU1598178.1 30S ribosomal protein S2 [Nanoarchaeota archaeon]MBU2441308.1 30S ribosomal protein S2 [Nanoarchaeota archaeon]